MEKEKIIEKLLARFKECPSQEFTVRELAEGLKMNDSISFKFVVQAIAQMEHDKQITLNQNGAFTLAQDNSLPKFTGIFHANDRGFGFVTVDPEQPDFFINPTQTLSALNGDEVEVEMLTPGDEASGKRPDGKVVAIVEHNLTQQINTELLNIYNIHFGKIYIFQHIIMMVVGNNVVRIGRNGTIHKLIVIRIDCNQIKVIEWSYQFNKRTVQYGFHHIFRRFIVGKSLQNFYIFLQYFIGYTELVLSVHKGLPQDMVTTPLRNALNKTIRTKNQLAIDVILMNGYPFQLFHPAFSGQEFPYPKVHPTLYSSVWNNIERAPLSILPDLPEIYRKKTFPTNASVWG